ncbi:crotonase/enoyl-CoA hydratase family protein [Rhodococcus sp. Eu-32]|uniref:crotonase/enoyl-CoA hydratase family protein n=1 Tax=Rhodococcus sp. Eu-32 TaxID=1017319 RepID=UPI000DF271B3|nr:crotonase/enoyl-CoA hydratase family protein [Rhodococcus sp. Eu-32]RRQ26600.1 crotonase/enoyl-CoA hydratase family protein [Rhodococcus sp. Eu-32]
MSSTTIDEPAALVERRGNVAVVSLNRPRALNAVDSTLSTAVGNAVHAANVDPDVRAIVLTGSGRAFCAGADLKEIAAGRSLDADGHPEWGFAGFVRQWVDKPTIAAVNGFALGGGTELLLACDLAVVDETAALGLPEVKRGLFAGAGGVLRMSQQIPRKIALEIALTGEPITAARAYELGLINRVAPQGTSLDVALELAESIAVNAPLSVVTSKQLVHESANGDTWGDGLWARNQEAMNVVFSSADAHEGATAFGEKRQPVWTGK